MPVDERRFVEIARPLLAEGRFSRGDAETIDQFLEETRADEHARALYRHAAFELVRERLSLPGHDATLEVLEGIVKRLVHRAAGADAEDTSPKHNEAYFSSIDDCVSVIVDLISNARHTMDICVFTITDDRVADSIVRAHRQGRSIRIITDDDKAGDLGSDIDRLRSLGIPTRQDRSERHMHHKFAIFDAETLLTGSYNWTRGAADRNLENLIVTSDQRLLRAFTREFERLWSAILD